MKSLTLALLTGPTVLATLLGTAVQMSALWFGSAEVRETESYTSFVPPEAEPGRHDATVRETRQVVPSLGVASDVVVQSSNNALDAVHYRGRTYLAFRTAPQSYPNPDASVYVVSSGDDYTFRKETEVFLASELQAPRLMVFRDQLFLYVSKLGTSRYEVDPLGVYASRLGEDGQWSRLRPLDLRGHIVWQTRVAGGIPLMTAYVGGHSVYQVGAAPLQVRLLTTSDGFDWHPLLSADAQAYQGGGGEAAFSDDDDGNLFSVVNNDTLNRDGGGSSVCIAASGNWTNWDCVNDPRRFNSPQLFSYDGEVYLIARRELAQAHTSLPDFGSELLRNLREEFNDLSSGQRCTLFRYIKTQRRLGYVMDLPAQGDTCSAAVVPTANDGEFAVYNVSSPLDGPDLSLAAARRAPSRIYRYLLALSHRGSTQNVAY